MVRPLATKRQNNTIQQNLDEIHDENKALSNYSNYQSNLVSELQHTINFKNDKIEFLTKELEHANTKAIQDHDEL